jgi:hypothetical protein
MAGQRLRNAAAMVALLYVGVQAFQEYVYRTLPTPSSPADELMAGASSLHVARSTLLLFAMFGLLFIFGVIALAGARRRPVLAGAAFLAYVVFFLLEIGLRSTELFWIQLQLPAAYAASHDPALVEQMQTFQAVQGALYFPLGFSTLLGSVMMMLLFDVPPRRNWVVRIAFGWNALRIAARQLTAYAGIAILPAAIYETYYFPITVLAFYVPVAWWLWRAEPALPPAAAAS